MKVHLVDGTYELFRGYYAMPPITAPDGRPVAAVCGLVQTMLALLRQSDVTHVACAFDHVVESFRNDLFAGYKTGAGVPEDLMGQFELAEQAITSLGIVVWPMIEYEADDALATAASKWRNAPGVEQVVICSTDKDLTQLVRDQRVVCLDRRKNVTLDEAGVWGKFEVSPGSIPDYLALVGDAADGISGIPKWGAKTSSLLLQRYGLIGDIPDDWETWDVELRGAKAIAASLSERRDDAMLYKQLATLRLDVPLDETLDQIEWHGARKEAFQAMCSDLGFRGLMEHPGLRYAE